MGSRKVFVTAIAGLALGVASLPLASTVFAATNTKGLVPLSVQGVGPGAIAAPVNTCTFGTTVFDCADSDTCECVTGTDTLIGNQGFAKGSLGFGLIFDESVGSLPASTFGNCYPGTGLGLLSNSKGNQTVSIYISGLACPTGTVGLDVFNGTYSVISGTGKYSASSGGTGAISGSVDTTSGLSQASVTGSLMTILPTLP
ncbi:MAG TPA: hypothetical protein VMU41_07070 [Candidatus Binataceae bacterium]|nr:hypothetical protein [Candidatus Binataceae bacterium]